MDHPRGTRALPNGGSPPAGVRPTERRSRHEDQTVPYVGDLASAFAAADERHTINPEAVKLVRALLQSTPSTRSEGSRVTQVTAFAEAPTVALADPAGQATVRSQRGEPVARGDREPRPPDPLLGRVIGDRYLIRGLLATGGMGRVYRAQQTSLGRAVAVKVLEKRDSSDPNACKRFFREAAVAAKLHHPNTVKIFDYGVTHDNVYYIAMELLSGSTLRQVLERDGPLSTVRTIHIARQICRSLSEAHALGVIHRDLKPSNIHLVPHGDEPDFVKVLDFGLVKQVEDETEALTQTGLFMGSPRYSAPEQLRGLALDARTDIYSLGVVMLEMLTGNVPFPRPGSFDSLTWQLPEYPSTTDASAPGRVEATLHSIVAKCLQKNPSHRYASMDELHAALVATDPRKPRAASQRPNAQATTPTSKAPSSDLTVSTRSEAKTSASPRTQPRRFVMAILVILAVLSAVTLLARSKRVEAPRSKNQSIADAQPSGTADTQTGELTILIRDYLGS